MIMQRLRFGGGGSGTSRFRTISFPLVVFFLLAFLPETGASTIGVITVKGLHSISQEEFRALLGLKEGDELREDSIRRAVKRIFLKGIFEDIVVERSDEEPGGLTISVRERAFVRKVLVRGEFALSSRLLRELFLIKEGEILRQDLFGESAKDLREKLSYRGYPAAEVEITTEGTSTPFRIDLVLKVHTGDPLRIRGILISGTTEEVRDVMKLSPGDVYDQHLLEADLRRIKAYFKKRDHYAPLVGPYVFHDGLLEISVRPGKRLSVSVEGNSAISAKTLLKEVPFFEIEALNDEIVAETVDRIRTLYYEQGYAFAQIAPVLKATDESIEITFFVFEGTRVKVNSIRFTGASLPEDSLKKVLRIREGGYFDSDILEGERESLKEFYGALGFLDAEIGEAEARFDEAMASVDVTFPVEEGEKTIIESVEVVGAEPSLSGDIASILGIAAGDPYNEIDISDARFRVLDYYAGRGYPSIDILVEREAKERRVALRFVVLEGVRSYFGKTIITGNRRTKYEVIRRELVLREGEPYSLRSLAASRQRLYRLGLFTDVDLLPLDAEDNRKDVLVTVGEGNAGAVEFGFGYAEYERFRGFLELSYRNLWGMNRQGLMRVEASSLESRYLIQYYEPWFLGVPLPFRASFLYDERTEITVPRRETRYHIERYSLSAGIEKKLSERLKAELYYEYSIVRTSDVQPDVVLSKEDVGRLAIGSIRPALIYDTRDNPFEPSSGILAGITLKLASPVLFSESEFAKFTVYGSTFFRVQRRMVLALSMRGGIAYGFGESESLPIVERFFLGGRTTVRGYEQDALGPKGDDGNPTGGNSFLLGSIELRTLIGRGFSIVPFFDMGNVWTTAGDVSPGDLRYTAGIGLRYSTPVGPLRVDYGFKLNKERGESAGELHFSIGHAF